MIDIEKMMSGENGRFDLLDDEGIPRFPLEIFPDDLQFIIKQLEKYASFEPQVIASSILFVASTIIGNSKIIEVKEAWRDTANIWIAIVGKRGTMKSPAISYCLKPLMNKEKDFAREFDAALASYYEIPSKDRNEINRPHRTQRFTNDTTVEGLIKAMEYNWNGMGIYKDELNGFFEEMNRYKSGGNLEFYLSAFNGGTYIKNRASYDPQTINDIYLSMVGSIQPEVLKAIASTQTNNGMIDRWLYVISNDKIPRTTLDDIDSSVASSFQMKVANWINNCKSQEMLEWLPGAKETFNSAINEMEDMMETNEEMLTYLSKLKTYFARFIVIICVIEYTNLIGIPEVNKAKQLIAYFLGTAQHMFVEFENQITLDKIVQIENASTKKEIVHAVIKHLPKLNNSQLSKFTGISRQYVIRVQTV